MLPTRIRAGSTLRFLRRVARVRLLRTGRVAEGKHVELRSDTLTRPTREMRAIMATAQVGDDCYGEDLTVQRLESVVSSFLGKEAGLFAASGTMTNLLAIAVHCARGDQIILGHANHVYCYEGCGASSLLGVSYRTVPTLPNGTNRLAELEDAVQDSNNFHFARSRMVAVETTHNKAFGCPLPMSFLRQTAQLCRSRNLIFHIDGARLMNASVALSLPACEIVKDADSVSLCLSKGLGAPVGSVLVGSKDFIAEARRQRKVLGGGWRQAGMLAAAGLYALERYPGVLVRDHENAQHLAQGLSKLPGIRCDPCIVHTNIVYFESCQIPAAELVSKLKDKYRIYLGTGPYKDNRIRAVTSLEVGREDIEFVLGAMEEIVDTSRTHDASHSWHEAGSVSH